MTRARWASARRWSVAVALMVAVLVALADPAPREVSAAAGGGIGGGSGPGAALPACRYDHVRTRFADPHQWQRTLLDTILRLPSRYAPERLVPSRRAGFRGRNLVHPAVVADLRAMRRAALAADVPVGITSSYRTMTQQRRVFDAWVAQVGHRAALRHAARPGHSEHHLGTAIDFAGGSRWLRKHAWQYGFVLSYPKGMKAETCYRHESWHYRYVGRAIAAAIHADDVTLRRYLWEHFESVD